MSKLDEIQDCLDRYEAPPDAALCMLQVVSDPLSSVDAVLAAIREQQDLTRGVLSLSNASIYDVPNPITDVSQIVAYLGAGTLVRMAVTLCAQTCFVGPNGESNSVSTWEHSVVTAIAAQLLAERKGAADPACAFTAGMLHNVGKLPMASFIEAEFDKLIETITDPRQGFADAERIVLGINHPTAGARLAERWRLPPNLRQAIQHHHEPWLLDEGGELASVVHIADIIAMQLGVGLDVEGLTFRVCDETSQRLHITEREMDEIRLEVHDELKRSEELMNLGHTAQPKL